jgi:hypothetical protein
MRLDWSADREFFCFQIDVAALQAYVRSLGPDADTGEAVRFEPVGCQYQYSVTAVDLRRLEPADVLMSHRTHYCRGLRASPEGTQEDHRGYMSDPYEDHARLQARRGGSYGPCPPLGRLLRGGPRTAVNQLRGCRDDLSIVV